MYGLETRILNQLSVGIWVARAPSGESIYANDAFAEIMGMAPVTDIGIEAAPAAYGIFDHNGAPFRVEDLPFSRVLTSNRPCMVEHLVIQRHDGRRVDIRAFAAPIRDAAGAIELIVVAFIDITAETDAVEKGQTLQQRLSFALNHSPVILFAVDRNGVITLSEGAALARLGFAPGQLVGRRILDIYGGRIAPDDVTRALRGEVVTDSVEVQGRIFDTCFNPIRDARGELAGFIGLSTDVTEQRQLQRRYIQNDRLSAMGTLAASVAHEINNPLAYIMGNLEQLELELARGDGGAPALAKMAGMVSEIRSGARRVQQVAKDLRSFARPDAEGVTAVSVHAVIRSVLQLVRKEIEARAELLVIMPETPPVLANEARLVQVVLNLLVNAWQALPDPDPRRHRITVSTAFDAGRVIIEIADTGTGVAPEHLQHIFEPFFTTKEIGGGTGLGLFVCRNLVAAFGGEISAHNRDQGGAVFRVQLPPAEKRHTLDPMPATSPHLGSPSIATINDSRLRTDQPRPRVLIIDDDEMVAGVLVHSLKGEFEARAIHDAHEALAVLLQDRSIDLVFCDLMMKGLTGMDIHEQVSQKAPEQLHKLVFMTGGAFTTRAASFIDEVGDAVVYKPFSVLTEARRRLALPDEPDSSSRS